MTTSPAPDLRLQIDRIKRLSPFRKSLYAAVVLAFLIVCAALWPPHHRQYDLRVYLTAADAFLHRSDVYSAHLADPDMAFGFTYPPFAVLLFAPLTMIGTESARLTMTVLSAVSLLVIGLMSVRAANRSLGYRFGTRLGWSRHRLVVVGLCCGVAGLAFEPVRITFQLGQINVILMATLLCDLLGYTPARFRGALVGLATGIKLTPGLFIVFLLLTRRYREAGVASGVTVGTMFLGWLVMPGQTVDYFTGYMFDTSPPGVAHLVANQSVRGVLTRVIGDTTLTGLLWPVAAAIACCLGLLAARRAHDRGFGFEAVLLVAATATLVSPISWTGHFVFALPTSIALAAWVYRTRGPVRHAVAAVAVFWTLSLTVGLVWLAPHFGDREFTHDGIDLILGNSYAISSVALVTAALLMTRRQQEVSGGRARAARSGSSGWWSAGGPWRSRHRPDRPRRPG